MISINQIDLILKKAKIEDDFINFEKLNGGANNQVFLLKLKNRKMFERTITPMDSQDINIEYLEENISNLSQDEIYSTIILILKGLEETINDLHFRVAALEGEELGQS